MKRRSASENIDSSVVVEAIERQIYLVRGHKVMLDCDLASLYRVTTGNLNLAVRRNGTRFPEDFMFQLNGSEAESLILQSARSKARGGRRHSPYVFTEQGVAMLSSVLRSERAVHVNIMIMRAFVKVRELLTADGQMASRLRALDEGFREHDTAIKQILDVIQQLVGSEPVPPQRQIGFIRRDPD